MDSTRETFDERVAYWTTIKDRTERDSYYAAELLPEICRRFRKTAEGHQYRGLILVGTLQPFTAVQLIDALNPERIAILLTNETRPVPGKTAGFCDDVLKAFTMVGSLDQLRCQPAQWLIPEGDFSEILSVYEGLNEILLAWNDLPRAEIAVDLTAGKTTMSVGLAKAAHALGITSVYVNSTYKGVIPTPGTQKFELTPDPYMIFGDLEAAEARRLYHAHDYLGAERIFDDLAQRVQRTTSSDRYRAYTCLTRAYAMWDVFAFGTALTEFEHLIHTCSAHFPEKQRQTLQGQYHALQILATTNVTTNTATFTTFKKPQPDEILALLGSLYTNALRREQQKRYDFAALLLYRCLELMSRRRLALRGIDTESRQSRPPGMEKQYRLLKERSDDLLDTRALRSIQRKIQEHPLFQILKPDDTTAKDTKLEGNIIELIRERNHARNQSILAHGLVEIDRQVYLQFRAVAEIMLARFLAIESQPFDTWLNTYTFITLE